MFSSLAPTLGHSLLSFYAGRADAASALECGGFRRFVRPESGGNRLTPNDTRLADSASAEINKRGRSYERPRRGSRRWHEVRPTQCGGTSASWPGGTTTR